MSKQEQASKIFATKNQVEEILDIIGKSILYYRILYYRILYQFNNDSSQNYSMIQPVFRYFKMFTGNIDNFFTKI